MSNPWVTWLHKEESEEEETLPSGFAAFMPRDKTATPPGEAMFLGRSLPKIISKQVTPPKMSPKEVGKAVNTTLTPFAYQYLAHTAKETKNKLKDDFVGHMQEITYPESLINEAVNRYLQKFQK